MLRLHGGASILDKSSDSAGTSEVLRLHRGASILDEISDSAGFLGCLDGNMLRLHGGEG